ncbi:FLYWCH zinc finger domain-containing protein [Phthorimaea operculella]|nr:FLYWCH zinc finger domain-containing protein [Phthorimaea operculella]
MPAPSSSQMITVKPDIPFFNQDMHPMPDMELPIMPDIASAQDSGFHFLSGFSVIPGSVLKQELSVAGEMPPPQVFGDGQTLPDLAELSGPKFTTSQRGHVVIHWGNYRYNRHSKYKKSKVLWRCCRWTAGCRAQLYSFNDKIITKKNEHNHV